MWRLIFLLFLAGCAGKPFLVLPTDADGWCDKRGQCCCVVDNCLHHGKEMRCVYHRWCSEEQIWTCIRETHVQ
jgi:hypothetical protein